MSYPGPGVLSLALFPSVMGPPGDHWNLRCYSKKHWRYCTAHVCSGMTFLLLIVSFSFTCRAVFDIRKDGKCELKEILFGRTDRVEKPLLELKKLLE